MLESQTEGSIDRESLRELRAMMPRLPRRPTYRYQETNGSRARARMDTIDLGLLRLRDGDRLLDVGCGNGRHVLSACLHRCTVIGLDRALWDLRATKFLGFCLGTEGKLRASGTVLQGDALHLPFADASLDRIICTEVFEHVENDEVLASELTRVLRPGGTIAVSVPDGPSEWLVWQAAALHNVPPGEHVRRYRRGQMERLLRSHGFDVYARRFLHCMETPYWLIWFGSRKGDIRWRLSRAWHGFFSARAAESSPLLMCLEDIGNKVLPKSAIFYARKAREAT
jgi:SAM-dependent methyltransferase